MSTVVFSRLVQPQFSFLFSNYNPSNVKTTMKAHIELDNLQLHPRNMSFFLSAFGPFSLTSGTIGHLSIKKSLISADTNPIRIEVTDLVMNLDLNIAPIDFDLSTIPGLSFPAENIEAELDTASIKLNNLKLNINILGKYIVAVYLSNFSLYATNEHFLISTPQELRQLISQKGLAYNQFFMNIDKICILARRPNFDELVGQIVENMPVLGTIIVKKRVNTPFNTSEFDLFTTRDMAISINNTLLDALNEIKQVLSTSYKMWDFRKHMLQVVNHVPAMLWFVTRISANFQSITFHLQTNLATEKNPDLKQKFIFDVLMKKGLSITNIFYPDCVYVSRRINVIPEFELFINGEEFIKGHRGSKTLSIPKSDIIDRTYLNPKNFFFHSEQLINVKDSIEQATFTIPGKLFINSDLKNFELVKDKLISFLDISQFDKEITGSAELIEICFPSRHEPEEKGKKTVMSVKDANFDIKKDSYQKFAIKMSAKQISGAPEGVKDKSSSISAKNGVIEFYIGDSNE